MHAAVVHAFDAPPTYQPFELPQPVGDDEVVVTVIGSALHPRVRSQANGSHYTSTDELPLVPGVDGVGRLPTGELVYFLLPDTTLGAMAERTIIDRRRSIVLPDDVDPLLVAAGMNPGMSSWIALRRRIVLAPGAAVLVLGATGSAGRMALQIARHLGAGTVIGAGRGAERLALLPQLGADELVSLEGAPDEVAARLGHAARDVDVVIDYLWGPPAAHAMRALALQRSDRGKELRWIQIGSVAGATAEVPSEALRAANLRIMGSGQGSVGTAEILAELPALVRAIANGTFTLRVTAEPLSQVERVWTAPAPPGTRVVLTP
jgi:NADPH:quinone reductase-like Zn-dependent oxidoreductase